MVLVDEFGSWCYEGKGHDTRAVKACQDALECTDYKYLPDACGLRLNLDNKPPIMENSDQLS